MIKIKEPILLFKNLFIKKQILTEAAALSFVTLIGFIPLMIFLLFIVPEIVGKQINPIKTSEYLLKLFIPEQAKVIGEYINSILLKSNSINIISLFFLAISSNTLIKMVVNSFDKILEITDLHSEPFFYRVIKIIGMFVLGMLIVILLFSLFSINIVSNIIDFSIIGNVLQFLGTYFFIFILFVMIFLFIPTGNILKKNVLKVASITAVFWLFARIFFDMFISRLTNYNNIYGALAYIPIFLIWLYTNWIVILSGVVLLNLFSGKKIKGDEKNVKIKIEFNYSCTKDKEIILEKMDIKNILKEVLLPSDDKNSNGV